jgi:carbonic anhydrase
MEENVLTAEPFAKAAGVATAVGVAEASLGSALAHADLTKELRDKMTPDEIIQLMKAGNERFQSGKPQHRDLMSEAKATARDSILPRLSSAVLTREHPPS